MPRLALAWEPERPFNSDVSEGLIGMSCLKGHEPINDDARQHNALAAIPYSGKESPRWLRLTEQF